MLALPSGLTRGSPPIDPASYTGHYLKQVLKRRPSSKAGGKRPAETQGRGVQRRNLTRRAGSLM